MRNIIGLDEDKCVGCNRCIRVCPSEMANIAYLDINGAVKVTLDSSQCIACGACISVCEHNARHYFDDIDAFFADLAAGEHISLLVAPSVRTNMPQWRRLFSWLRERGVAHIYDVSLGADICVWGHLRHMERNPGQPLITQPCPAIVSYCEILRHELLPYLSPVHSPMACAVVYMRKYLGVEGKIAAISPCIAKSNEFESTGIAQYNVTFANLLQYIATNDIDLPQEKSDFDHAEAGLGKIFPVPGGLKANIEFFTGANFCVEKSGPQSVYAGLDDYAATPEEFLPDIFDVLNCDEGCSIGTGCVRPQNSFALQKKMDAIRRNAVAGANGERHRETFAEYDRVLRLEDFYREYQAIPKKMRMISEQEILDVFVQMGKNTFVKQNYNCGACGAHSCRNMAHKIALGVNVPVNCAIMSRDDAERGRTRIAAYMALVHQVGETLFAARSDDSLTQAVHDSLRALAEAVGGEACALWRHEKGSSTRLFGWFNGAGAEDVGIQGDWPKNWISAMQSGAVVQEKNIFASDSGSMLFPEHIQTVLCVPIHFRETFWGFLVATSAKTTPFSNEETALVDASGILIASSILEHELAEHLIRAREQAVAGTRAKSDFLSRMSHEMRTPLNAVIGMTRIADRTLDVDKLRYCLSTIRASSAHLLGLINDVLDMAKIEAGKLELGHMPLNLEKALSNVCDIISENAEKKDITLRIHLDGALHRRYLGDKLRLSQVVANLLGNAVKFTPEGGEVVLTVKEKSRSSDISRLHFTVRDTGIGITEDQAARLFTAFEQAGAEIAQNFGGTGLGLAISKSIVESMNGTIGVTSTPGQGAEFVFEVDLQRDQLNYPSERTQQNLAGSKVLFVCADATTSSYFSSIVELAKIACECAVTVEDALRRIRESVIQGKPYDVIFLTLRFKGVTAQEVLAVLGKESGDIPVVAAAPFLEWHKVEAAANRAGITRFVSLPIFPSPVMKIMRSILHTAAIPAVCDQETLLEKDFSSVTLLLAEDIALNREIFITLLEDTRITIDVAENGQQAVEMFVAAPEKYTLIVMDIQMPVMDGYTASKSIRALEHPRAQSVPIVAMTANAFKEDIDRAMECGMNDHLSKPINEEAVIAVIEKYKNA